MVNAQYKMVSAIIEPTKVPAKRLFSVKLYFIFILSGLVVLIVSIDLLTKGVVNPNDEKP
jgi:hypothetical protein